jgi:D-alanyl-D-alanine carboxypeptidase
MSGTAGIDGTLSRITELRTRFAVFVPPTPTRTGAAGAAGAGTGAVTFADELATASAALDTPATGEAPLTPAVKKAPGTYGTLTPPAELAGYGNGRIPTDRLTPLGVGDHRLYAPAGGAFRQMAAAAKAAGVTIGVNDSYRDLPGQEKIAREKGIYGRGGVAAVPGTSNHGWGLALDLELDGKAQQWMRDNGARFGFVEDVAGEPWHWTYRPSS